MFVSLGAPRRVASWRPHVKSREARGSRVLISRRLGALDVFIAEASL
jgi:hypothetical protein